MKRDYTPYSVPLTVLLLNLFLILLNPVPTTAIPEKTTYVLSASVMGAAGSPAFNTTYRSNGTLGQPTPLGHSAAQDLIHDAGFWATYQRLTWVVGVQTPEPLRNLLYPNYPNPFNPTTTISYSVAEEMIVRIVVYDLRGEMVRSLINQPHAPGHHRIIWDGRDDVGRAVSSGIYFCQVQIGGYRSTDKMLLVK